MLNKAKLLNELLISVAGILVFVGLGKFIDLNGFSSYSILLIFVGILFMFQAKNISKLIKENWFSEALIKTIGYVLLFIGGKAYLDLFADQFWVVFIIIGIILLNTADWIVEKISKR